MSDFDAMRARSKRPMPLWVDAFKRDTGHFEADEIGAYFNLLMAMWSSRDLTLPDDPKRLARAAGVSVRLWNSRISEVILPMLTASNGVISQARLQKEATYVERQVQQQHDRKAGKKHGKSLKTNNPHKTVDTSTDQSTVNPSQQPNNLQEREAKASLSSDNDPAKPSPVDDISEAVTEYNLAAVQSGWPKVAVLSKPRRSALSARLRESGGIEGWRTALSKAQASAHCCGQNDRGWVASFDFLTKQSSFTKLMEGNYDNRTSNQGNRNNGGGYPGQSQNARPVHGVDPALERIARLARAR